MKNKNGHRRNRRQSAVRRTSSSEGFTLGIVKGDISEDVPSFCDIDGERICGEIVDITSDGRGVLKSEGIVYFIEAAGGMDAGVIGDEVAIRVKKRKKRFAEAIISEILKPSTARVHPDCEAFQGSRGFFSCGGCDFRHVAYEAQLDWKRHLVENAFRTVGNLRGYSVERLVGAARRYGYRNHVQLPVRIFDGRVRLGFFSKKSEIFVPTTECKLIPDSINRLIPRLECAFERMAEFVYPGVERKESTDRSTSKYAVNPHFRREERHHEKKEEHRQGYLKHVGIRISPKEEISLILVVTAPLFLKSEAVENDFLLRKPPAESSSDLHTGENSRNALRSDGRIELHEILPECLLLECGIVSVYENIHPGNTGTYGPHRNLLYGAGEWEESLLGRQFSLSPASFFQIHREQAEILYRTVIEYAFFGFGIKNGPVSSSLNTAAKPALLDLYSGVGSIGICASDFVSRLVGIELVPEAIEHARKNSKRNGVSNAEFYAGACEDLLSGILRTFSPDVVILDPPRAGADEATLRVLVEKAPERIVYVSCNPATLARDVRYITANGYHLENIAVVDMFPYTVHVETIALIQRVKS